MMAEVRTILPQDCDTPPKLHQGKGSSRGRARTTALPVAAALYDLLEHRIRVSQVTRGLVEPKSE